MLELNEAELAIVRELLARRLPGYEVRAFGSLVRGRAKRHSDLDLVVMSDAPLPDWDLAELRADFEESDLPFRVDVVASGELPESLREEIALHSAAVQRGDPSRN
jgi:uncharacterized protein